MSGLSGFDMRLLEQKYAAMTTSANADAQRAQAQSNLMNAQARAVGSPSGMTSDGLDGLRAGLIQAQTKQALAGANAANTTASIGQDENLRSERAADQGFNSGMLTRDQLEKLILSLRDQQPSTTPAANKKGLAKVPKTAKTTVHKGEAILNKPAADKLGRGLIAMMNVEGQQKMGMV